MEEDQPNINDFQKLKIESMILIEQKKYIQAKVIGDQLFQAKKYAEAIEIYKGIIQKNPEQNYNIQGIGNHQESVGFYQWSMQKWYKENRKKLKIDNPYDALSLCCLANSKSQDQIKWYRNLANEHKDNYQLHFGLANILCNNAIYEQAIQEYQKCIDLKPQFVKSYIDLSLIYQYKRIHKRKSVQWADKILQIEKNNQYALFILARNEKDIDSKIQKLYETWLIDTKYTRVCNEMGICYGGTKKQYKEAIQWYKQCLQITPQYSSCYNNIGVNYQLLKDYQQAKQWYYKGVIFNNQYKTAYKNLSDIFDELKMSDEAIMEDGLQHKVKLDLFYYYLGLSYYDKKNVNKSYEWFNRAIKLNDKEHRFFNSLAISYDEDHKYQEAIHNYKKCIEINPKFHSAYYNMAIVYKSQNKIEEAIEWYKKSLEISPRYSYAYNNLGNIYKNQQQYKQAINYYQKAVQFNNSYTLAYANLGLCYLKTDRFKKAYQVFSVAQELINNDNNNLSKANKQFLKPQLQKFQVEGFKWSKFAQSSDKITQIFIQAISYFIQSYTAKKPNNIIIAQDKESSQILQLIAILAQDNLKLKQFKKIFILLEKLFYKGENNINILCEIFVDVFWRKKVKQNEKYHDIELQLEEILEKEIQNNINQLQISPQIIQHKESIQKQLIKYHQVAKNSEKINYFNQSTYFTSYEELINQIKKISDKNNQELPSFNELLETISAKFNLKDVEIIQRLPMEPIEQFRQLIKIVAQIFEQQLNDCVIQQLTAEIDQNLSQIQNKNIGPVCNQFVQRWINLVNSILVKRHQNNIQTSCFISDFGRSKLLFTNAKDLVVALNLTYQICQKLNFSCVEIKNRLLQKKYQDILIVVSRNICSYQLKFALRQSQRESSFMREISNLSNSSLGIIFQIIINLTKNKTLPLMENCQKLSSQMNENKQVISIYQKLSQKYRKP